MSNLIADFYRQNEWANLALIDHCRPLTDEQLDDASVVGVYGSIRDTLTHIVGAEGGYAARLGDTDLDRHSTDDPWPGFDRLAQYVRLAAASLTVHAESLPMAPFLSRDGKSEIDAEVALVQMYHHSTHHRAEICTVLTQLGLEPLDLSAWSWGEADKRIRPV
jgi:uncharacterized damage-inducible protein DinB